MSTIADFVEFFARHTPPRLAADWDNVGLLVGDATRQVSRVLTCLTVTDATVQEAIDMGANLLISHHPFPFKAEKRWTADTTTGRLLLALIEHKIAVYSPHTAFDSAELGINQQLATRLGLTGIQPLAPDPTEPTSGIGRQGNAPPVTTLGDLAATACQQLSLSSAHIVGDPARPVTRVGVGCGAADELLGIAMRLGCDCFVTGEARFHTALAAAANQMTMLLLGHYASERFAVEELARVLGKEFTMAQITASAKEADPLVLWRP
ncbi:MAG: Nif3-like dinuclear metal center hexameric protein [Pirellulales bacterium]|nr:Nif3-like dinuclear metal center hexameric protein [Pirellulales bacterium]